VAVNGQDYTGGDISDASTTANPYHSCHSRDYRISRTWTQTLKWRNQPASS
jgi:hypothetical protein